MAKRKLTTKQLAALARGRAKRTKKAHKRTETERRALGYRKERKRTMAKRKRRAAPRKRRAAPRRSARRRGGGRGGMFSGIDWQDMAGAGAYGWLEKQYAAPPPGKTADEALITKVPLFFEGIGYAGCSAVIAHIIGKNVGGIVGKAARHYAKGTFDVAAYKLARHGKLYESKDEAIKAMTELAGDDELGDDEVGIELEGDDELGDDEVGYGADGIAGDDD